MKSCIALCIVAASAVASPTTPITPQSLTDRGVALPNRDIQIVKVHLGRRVLQLQNLGTTTIDLTGWRFCSHDDAVIRRYSGANGLSGRTLAAGGSLFVHFNGDAPASANAVNSSALGGQFANIDNGPIGISLYFPGAGGTVSFADGTTQADHLQWSIGGVSDPTADERSDEAVAGGTWTAIADWISTAATSEVISLRDLSGAELHGPANYLVLDCEFDLDLSGSLDFFDLLTFLNGLSTNDPISDLNLDGSLDFFDVITFLSGLASGC